MQNQASQADSDDFSPEEEIQKISQDPSSVHSNEHETKCRCECHLSVNKSNKAYAIVPIKQNGNIINIVKLPLYKMHKQPKKTLFGYTKYRIVLNDPNHYQMPVWHLNQSEISSCFNCEELEEQNHRRYSDAICQTDEPIMPEVQMPPTEEPRKVYKRRSGEIRPQLQPNSTKWQSLFVNDKSYSKKRSDG